MMRDLLLLVAAVTGCAGGPAGQTSARVSRPAPELADFVQRLDSLRIAAGIPGLSVAVVRDQQVVLAQGLGLADLETGAPATARTAYNIASVTKPLSAVVALRLAELGVLDLDRPIGQYSSWAEFCAAFREQASIFAQRLECDPATHTLRHLLSHTATARPGTRFSYNPVLYSWASRPISAAARAPFSDLVAQYVLVPAGMEHSARVHRDLPLRRDLIPLLAPPHRRAASGGMERAPLPPPQGDGAAGGIISTVLDLARFDIALDRDVLISAASRTAMMTPAFSPDGHDIPYGLGWFIQEYRGRTLIWHSGWWEDAYSALYLKVPDLNLSFILLANSEGAWWDNPLDRAEVEHSKFAQAFLRAFVPE